MKDFILLKCKECGKDIQKEYEPMRVYLKRQFCSNKCSGIYKGRSWKRKDTYLIVKTYLKTLSYIETGKEFRLSGERVRQIVDKSGFGKTRKLLRKLKRLS